jgi:Ser-tRNA(Ala) deacylase AlaX
VQHQIYLEDTYRFEVHSQVVAAGISEMGPWFALEENIFHPQGGGQPSDVGTVNAFAARPFRSPEPESREVWLSSEGSFAAGDQVISAIDPEVRRRHAALHTCGHVVDAFVRSLGLHHRVSNHFPGQARIEFDSAELRMDTQDLAAFVQEKTQQAIDSDHKVHAEERDGLRIVTIDGVNEDPCGGTHVTSLACLTGFSVRSVKVKGGVLKVGYTVEHAG